MNHTKFFLVFLEGELLFMQMTGNGTRSAQRGRTPLELGSCSKMDTVCVPVEVIKKVQFTMPSN